MSELPQVRHTIYIVDLQVQAAEVIWRMTLVWMMMCTMKQMGIKGTDLSKSVMLV
jgi:hypothetical protein